MIRVYEGLGYMCVAVGGSGCVTLGGFGCVKIHITYMCEGCMYHSTNRMVCDYCPSCLITIIILPQL